METKHSVKLSTQYRAAVKILRRVIANGESLKTLLFNEKHARTNRLNALLDKFFRNREIIEKVIEKSEILVRETRFDPYVCRVLLTELLIGYDNGLTGQAKPIQTILTYKTELLDIFNELKGENFKEKRNVPLPRYVRINTLKITFDDALEECRRAGFNHLSSDFKKYPDFLEAVKNLDEYDFLFDFHVKHLLVFAPKTRVYWARSPLVAEHKFILQDKASCLPPILLELPKKSCILDMCAAPGMKTSQMAAIIKNKGKIYANDYDKTRYELLCENLKNKNVKFIPINRDATELTAEEYPNVEYILVDPSCSSSGMASRAFDKQLSKERIQGLSKLQTRLLVHTLQSFPNAKRVVYSTCSILHEENEYVITKALARCPNFVLLDPRGLLGDSWINFGSEEYRVGDKCIYSYEETDLTNGFFCAIFVNKNIESNEEIVIKQDESSNDEIENHNEIDAEENVLSKEKKFKDEKMPDEIIESTRTKSSKKKREYDNVVEVTVDSTEKTRKKARKEDVNSVEISLNESKSLKKKKKNRKDQDHEQPEIQSESGCLSILENKNIESNGEMTIKQGDGNEEIEDYNEIGATVKAKKKKKSKDNEEGLDEMIKSTKTKSSKKKRKHIDVVEVTEDSTDKIHKKARKEDANSVEISFNESKSPKKKKKNRKDHAHKEPEIQSETIEGSKLKKKKKRTEE